jgi:hypothetical protein
MVPVPLGQTSLYILPNTHLQDRAFEAIYLCSGSPLGKSGILVWDIHTQKIRSVILEGVKYYLNDFPLRKQNCILTYLLQVHRQVGDAFDLEIEEKTPQVQPNQNQNDEGVPREVLPPRNELSSMAASTGDKNELHPDHPVPQPAVVSTEGGNQNIGQFKDSLQKNFATLEPVQRQIEVTPSSEIFADMQDSDAPRSKRSTTAADLERSKAGNLPKYF